MSCDPNQIIQQRLRINLITCADSSLHEKSEKTQLSQRLVILADHVCQKVLLLIFDVISIFVYFFCSLQLSSWCWFLTAAWWSWGSTIQCWQSQISVTLRVCHPSLPPPPHTLSPSPPPPPQTPFIVTSFLPTNSFFHHTSSRYSMRLTLIDERNEPKLHDCMELFLL